MVTEPVRHQEVNNALVGSALEADAVAYVKGHDTQLQLGLSDDGDYDPLSVVEDAGLRHVKLQQTYLGVPIVASEIIVHASDDTFVGFNGYVTRNLDGFDVNATVSGDQALDIARRDYSSDSLVYSRETSRLAILPRPVEGADLVWQIELRHDVQPGHGPGRWHYFIDARAGTIVKKFDGLHTLEQASGPGGNARVSRTWSAQLDVESDDGEFVMDTERQETRDLEGEEDGGEAFRAPALDQFDDPDINDAHGHTEIALDMMRDWMGRVSIDDNGFKIISRVHVGENVDIAWWDGEFTNYGDSNPDVRYPRPGALDVVAHEMNHGFTEFHSGLVYENESGGLNESFSDVAGTLAEFYRGNGTDMLIAEDIYVAADGAHRDMCQPASRGSIQHLDDYEDGHEVHSSSGIGNRAFCLAVGRYRASTGASPVAAVQAMGQVWYTANAAYWTSGTTYLEACRGTVDAARARGLASDVVKGIADSWADVGAGCDTSTTVCNDDGTCDAAAGETCASCPDDCGSCAQDCSFWKKAKCKIGIGDCSQCSDDSGCGDHICDGDETDSNCPQDCGCAAYGCEDLSPYGCWCDPICEDIGDCCADRGEVCALEEEEE
ncbi:MAG TPA: M4 family metallopeptidase [Kofleriaceae bacterium]|nr:M4 family metallopeptidase [Kofleriaceae bacterium]